MPELSLGLGKYALATGYSKTSGLYVKAGRNLPMGGSTSASRYGGNGRSWFFSYLPGATIDYERKAGDAWKNGVISAALGWIARNLPYAPLAVFTEDANGDEKIVPKHPLAELLKRPNKYYDGKTLLQATFLSLIAGRGNAYWWVKRDNVGRPIEFWYLPHFECWPIWNNESTTNNWITGYAYRQNGITYTLKESDVIHFRDGLDPECTRIGLDPLKATARERVVDNAASGYAAQLLENMAIPGAIISPADKQADFDAGDYEDIKASFEISAGGDNRFRPMVATSAIKIEKLSFSPQELLLDTVQNRPEARLLAQIGISPMVLGLTVGLEHSTYSNMETAEIAAWYNCIMPRIALICSELDTQALAFYPGHESLHVGGDYRKVPALQEDLAAKHKYLSLAVGGPYMTRNEARQALGFKDLPDGDELYQVGGGMGAADGQDGKEAGQDTPAGAKSLSRNGHKAKELAWLLRKVA